MNQKKLLIVEDDDLIRDLYQRQFARAGFVVDGVASGSEGLVKAVQNKYDLIILDIMLPDMNGLDILQQLKANAATKTTPVVMLTNLGQDDIVKKGFSLGAEGYFIKLQYTPDQIVQEIKNILEGKSGATPL